MNKKYNIRLDETSAEIFNSNRNIDDFIHITDKDPTIEKQLKDYEYVEYPIKLQLTSDEAGTYWVAEHPDLPGCVTHGNTKAEALANLVDAKMSWIHSALTLGEKIPSSNLRAEIEECSGKILLRIPKELHYRLLKKAKEDETSLNQELLFLISSALGARKSPGR